MVIRKAAIRPFVVRFAVNDLHCHSEKGNSTRVSAEKLESVLGFVDRCLRT